MLPVPGPFERKQEFKMVWVELVLKYHMQHRTRRINLCENLHFIHYHLSSECVSVYAHRVEIRGKASVEISFGLYHFEGQTASELWECVCELGIKNCAFWVVLKKFVELRIMKAVRGLNPIWKHVESSRRSYWNNLKHSCVDFCNEMSLYRQNKATDLTIENNTEL